MGKTTAVSPFAPSSLPDVPPVPGVRFATAEAGIRYKGRTDLLLAVLEPGTTVAGVLTFTAGAIVALWPLWAVGLALVAGGLFVYRP